MEPFIIENAGNTCYIDSLLMALFYNQTNFDRLLNKEIENTLGLYLQEYIKEKFINNVRQSKSVTYEDIEMIRTLCFHMGWRSHANNKNNEEYINQQDVNEFFIFLMDIFEAENIEIMKSTISDNNDETDNNAIEKIPFIPLSLPENVGVITIKQMLFNWLYDNITDVESRNVHSSQSFSLASDKVAINETFDEINNKNYVKGLHTYNIINMPYMLCLSVNRFNNQGNRIETDVIIQKIICPYDNKFLNSNRWGFHAAICHRGSTNKSGHYYTLLTCNQSWYIFDDLEIPCMIEVKMDDKNVTNMIKKECVFLIYKLM